MRNRPADVYGRIGRLGPYFAIGIGDGRPILDLYRNAGGALDALVADHARKLRTVEHRVAASILFQGFAARIVSPVLGSLALDLPSPDLAVGGLRWHDEPFGLRVPEPRTTGGGTAELVGEHLSPMAGALHEATGVAVNLLWGNAASALAGTLMVLHLNGLPAGRATAEVRNLLDTPPLRGTGTLDAGDPPAFRRRSCCLYYRVPGGGLCGDCCLTVIPGSA